jgi:hypothetical protein
MDYFVWSTGILTVWAALGPLVGVGYGQELARRNQKAQWVADSRKKEFRELLNVLDGVFAFYVRENVVKKEEKASQKEYLDLNHKAMWCIRDRLFIADDMERLNVLERWRGMMNGFLAGGEFGIFSTGYNKLREEIMKVAREDTKP